MAKTNPMTVVASRVKTYGLGRFKVVCAQCATPFLEINVLTKQTIHIKHTCKKCKVLNESTFTFGI